MKNEDLENEKKKCKVQGRRRKCKDYTKSYSLNRLRRAHSQKCQRGLVNLPASHPKRSGTFEAFGHCISFGIVLALPIFAVGKLFFLLSYVLQQ